MLDGVSYPVQRQTVKIDYRDDTNMASETREVPAHAVWSGCLP